MSKTTSLMIAFLACCLAACGGKEGEGTGQDPVKDSSQPGGAAATNDESDFIRVQHILIGFKDAVGFRGQAPKGAGTRTREQAEALANKLLKEAQGGADFGELVKTNTDDAYPGVYGMVDHGKPPRQGYRPRNGMVAAFGNVGFKLKIGEVGMAAYDPTTSPFGWHIIKRISNEAPQAGPGQIIKVQHVLIGFKDARGFRGRPPPGAAKRTQAQAKELAEKILQQAQGGSDFGELVRLHTDDRPPGIYGIVENGYAQPAGYRPRSGLVPAFGDVGFSLKVGEIGMASYDAEKSPFGWHVIKRIE